jgi:hypothetical protein
LPWRRRRKGRSRSAERRVGRRRMRGRRLRRGKRRRERGGQTHIHNQVSESETCVDV